MLQCCLKLVLSSSRGIMKALAEQENWPVGWAFDGKNIFAPSLFLPQYEQSHEVSTHSRCSSCAKALSRNIGYQGKGPLDRRADSY